MTYSCADFADSVIEALGIKLSEDDRDNPEAQAQLALIEIWRMQQFEACMREALTEADRSPAPPPDLIRPATKKGRDNEL